MQTTTLQEINSRIFSNSERYPGAIESFEKSCPNVRT